MCENWNKTIWRDKGVKVNLKSDSPLIIKMLAPRLVLFEANQLRSKQSPNILQTGFLLLDVYFPDQKNKPSLDDLLLLNELFRYFGIPWDDHVTQYENALGNIPTEYNLKNDTQKTISDLIQRDNDNQLKAGYKEAYFSRWANLLEIPLIQNKDSKTQHLKLFTEDWSINAKKWTYDIYKSPLEEHWQVYADNRSYVWTAAILKDGTNALTKAFNDDLPKEKNWQAQHYGHWVKLLNVDAAEETAEKTHQSITEFEKQWVDQRTYKRWEQRGTWYGFSYHCGAMIGSQAGVYGLQYFDTSMLLFYIRLSLFRFNTRLSKIINAAQSSELLDNNKNLNQQLRQLRSEFSYFSILYQTPLLSNQQQSLEMYEHNKIYFEIDALYQSVKQEIDETHGLLEQREAISLGETANILAHWGIPFAAGGLITGLFGMSDFKLWEECEGSACFSWINMGIQLTIVTIVAIIAAIGIRQLTNSNKQHKQED